MLHKKNEAKQRRSKRKSTENTWEIAQHPDLFREHRKGGEGNQPGMKSIRNIQKAARFQSTIENERRKTRKPTKKLANHPKSTKKMHQFTKELNQNKNKIKINEDYAKKNNK